MHDLAVTPAHISRLLSAVDRPGDFYATGTVETATPAITVDRLRLSFPVPDAQARALIELAEPAPYGRGGETLVDPAVRKVWQIAASRVAIGTRWQRTLGAIVAEAAHGLGAPGSVRAELYKLLVYDRGSFFVEHRDTEKVDGMFGTLVVVLSSAHEGGELVVRHGDRDVRLDLRRDDPAEIAWCAFYADCRHELCPVTVGNRICLVYNLVRDGKGLSAPDHTDAVDVITDALRAYTAGGRSWPAKLAFALGHHYTPKGLSFAGLKNGDRAAAAVLVEAAGRAGCEVHLAMIAITETGSAEENYLRGRRQRPYDDAHFEVVEVFDRTVAAEERRAPDDRRPKFGPIPMECGELWPPDAIAEEKPDEQHYHEATGNEGAEFQRTYRRAALVVWPAGARVAALAQASPARTVALLEVARDPTEARDLAERILDRWPLLSRQGSWRWDTEYVDADAVHRRMLACLIRLGVPEFVERFLTLAARQFLDRPRNLDPVPALSLLPSDRAAAAATTLAGAGRHEEAVAFVRALMERERREVATAGAEVLVDRELPRWAGATEIEAVLRILWELDASAAAERFVARALATCTAERLLPVAVSLAPTARGRPGWDTLRRACVAQVRRDAGPVPPPPADLARLASWPCTCADCGRFRAFLASPTESSWSLKANEYARRHIEAIIERHAVEVDRTTLRTSPRTLVCTKNARRYEQAVSRRNRALEVLAVLGPA
jgi:hypothetical protein